MPFVELCKPGQPAHYSAFPYIALAVVVVSGIIAWITVRRHPSTGAGEGSALSES